MLKLEKSFISRVNITMTINTLAMCSNGIPVFKMLTLGNVGLGYTPPGVSNVVTL